MEVQDLLEIAIAQKASDLHIAPALTPHIRVDGELLPLPSVAVLSVAYAEKLVLSLMTKEQVELFKQRMVIDFVVSLPNLGHFRVSALHQQRGVAAVLRLIPEAVPTFEELGLPIVMKRLLALQSGLILVTGPTGSGKSTTLAAIIDYMNTYHSGHIITIEDPVEYIHPIKQCVINQLQVGRDVPDMATALRAALRQDPNIIMLGEMRDLDTALLALTAAETGHLVLATLHAASAPLSISRIVDIFPQGEKSRVRHLLSETLQAVIYQMLVKKISGGRAAAFEILLSTPAVRQHIRQDMIMHMESTMQTNGEIGMCTLEQYLQTMIAQQIISHATARQIVANREGFRMSRSTERVLSPSDRT